MNLTVARAENSEDLDAVRDLIRAFFSWAVAEVKKSGGAGNSSVFADLAAELAGLPDRFGPPEDFLILARPDGAAVDCVGVRDQGGGTMEIKRMFVRPEAWGRGVGAAMLSALLAEARAAGHARYSLSPHRDLHAAQALYARAGFQRVPASEEFPAISPEIDICMAMTPDATPGAAR